MLEIRNLTVSYHGLPVLREINLKAARGEVLAVTGESGAGKTTLGLSIMGLIEGDCAGEIMFKGRNILACPEEERRRMRGGELAMVFQNVADALHPLYNVHEQVAEAILVHGRPDGAPAGRKALDLLRSAGLDGRRAFAYPHQLSGGEKQRALIAMALANDPEILILDEPTASVDALTRAEIVNLLKEVTRNRITLVITHDLATAAALADKMAVLYGGRIVEYGCTGDLLAAPRHPYTRGLLRSYPSMTTVKDLQGIPGRMSHGVAGCPFHPRCTQKLDVCAGTVPTPSGAGGRLVACHRGGIVPMLQVRGLSKSFGEVRAVRDVDFSLYEGETLALVGESGSGKTTLARTIMGLCGADGGEIFLDGGEYRPGERGYYEKVQMIFQNPGESISHRMNVLQAVREPLDVNRWGTREERLARVRSVLEEVELPGDDGFLQKYPHHLSGGEVQRVAIARALVLNPKVLIADEPTSALDASVQARILRLLLNLQEKRGLALLLITHDIALARKVSDRMAVMLKGSIVEEGPAGEVTANPLHPYTRCLLQAAPSLNGRPAFSGTAKKNLPKEPAIAVLPGRAELPWGAGRPLAGYRSPAITAAGSLPAGQDGCPYSPRCPQAGSRCHVEMPRLKALSAQRAACFLL
ncbi:MAG: ABC transporter ATP-binding protein [Peptococcaceae bacterium]|nr:ABC transporter ATP-binding protein [Peptococcaceae bacterium]